MLTIKNLHTNKQPVKSRPSQFSRKFFSENNSTLKLTTKATLLFSLLFIASSLSSAAQSNTWVQKNDLGYDAPNVPEPSARYGAVGFSIGSKGYLGTGDNLGTHYKDFWEYDPALNTWTQKADFGGTARRLAVGFSIGSKGYLGTGYQGYPVFSSYKDFWEYDPALNTWTQKADFEGTARFSAVGFSISSKGYLGTGYSGYSNPYRDFWEYDPALNTWTKKADFGGTGRFGAVGFSISSKGYLGTGVDGSYNYDKDFWEYDPALNTWTKKADFGGTARFGAVGFSIGSKGYIGTGTGTYPFENKDFWEYDLALNIWTQKADFGGTVRADAVGFSIGSKGYLGTGSATDGDNKDFWEYDPALNTWTQKADFGGTARSSAVGFSIGSKGYLGTGFNFTSPYYYKDFWEYSPEVSVPTCPIPSTLATVGITSTTAKLKWQNATGALSYKVRYKIAGTSEWTITKALNNSKTLHGLAASTEYTWQVKSFCDIKPVVASDWSEKQFFTTLPLRLSEHTVELIFSIFPNPASESTTVTFSLSKASPVLIEMMDVNGRSLRVITKKDFSAGSHEVTFNRESLSAGIYFLKLKTDEGVMMEKVIIQ